MIKLTSVVLLLLVLVGCSNAPLTDRQVEAMNRPTITLNCTTGCQATYTDPRDRPSMPTNGWDVGITAINAAAGVVSSTAPWAAIGYTAVEGISNAVGDDNSSRSSDNSVQTTDNSVSTADNSTRIDDNSSRSVDNSVRTDDRSYDNSVRDNSVRDNSVRDNSVRDNRTFDSTHEPTVVPQQQGSGE